MANLEAGTSSDAGEYQVFLSFRGPDTRHGFTDFLYCDLVNAGVRVFKDDEELRAGDVIGGSLLHAINNSKIYIPIFSETYAFSKWCLRELAFMVDNLSKSNGQKSILPIFFHVEPEDVKLQTSLYSDAVLKHAELPEKVEAWRAALVEVGKITGWNVKKEQSQPVIVKLVVEDVLEKLEIKQETVTEHLFGLDDRVKHLTKLLDVECPKVQLIGIYGMGGAGKTTIAKVIFNQLSSHFGKFCSFLKNVRESASTEGGIVELQKKLLSDIVGSKSAEIVKDSDKGMRRIGETLSAKKVLVVLDDVNNKEHVKKLLGNFKFQQGSRIIITMRDKDILQVEISEVVIHPYEMKTMDDGHALRLFCWHAFGKDHPPYGYHWLPMKIVSLMGGLPLSIEVVGSLLKGKDDAFWKEKLVKLTEVLEKDILEKLRISYDDLEKYQKQIFLDIACFFFNKKTTDAIYFWESRKFYPIEGIDVLTKKCLVKISHDDKFWMHDQLIALGRQMIREESRLEKQSRLWIAEDVLQIIRSKERKEDVLALEIDGLDDSIEITKEQFENLPNLTFLNLRYGTYDGDFAECHSNLKWLSWHPPLQNFRADNINLKHLVVFKLYSNPFADDSKAWGLIKSAKKLKVLSLTECHGITTIPNISKCLDLERLTLAGCNKVKRIESFIGDLQSLIELEIQSCKGLKDLPEEVGALEKLKRFSLWGCSSLRQLPSSLENLTSLIELDLSRTGLTIRSNRSRFSSV